MDLYYFLIIFVLPEIISLYLEQLGVGGNINKGQDRIYFFQKWEKTSRRMRKPKNNITMA